MKKQKPADITRLLNQWADGDLAIEDELIKLIYPMLRQVAHQQLKKSPGMTMNTTVMVNELYLRLRSQNLIQLNSKNHFLAISARMVRQIIIDQIRSNKSLKRGGLYQQITLQEDELGEIDSIIEKKVDWLTLNKLLEELDEIDPPSVKLIELRFFVGLNIAETAEVCRTSESSISRNWRFAKNWLLNKLKNDDSIDN